MSRSIAVPVRRAILRRSRQGQDAVAIALAHGLSVRTVRRLLQRFRSKGPDAVVPFYCRCGRPTLQVPPPLVQEALQLREQHRRWGAMLIRVILRERHARACLPSARTLQRWFPTFASQACLTGTAAPQQSFPSETSS